jgi:hypothetical protein
MGRRFGLSWSWKRALGISAARGRFARLVGIPTTRSGLERKLGRTMTCGCCLAPAVTSLLAVAAAAAAMLR